MKKTLVASWIVVLAVYFGIYFFFFGQEWSLDEISYGQFMAHIQEKRRPLVMGILPSEEVNALKPLQKPRREIRDFEFTSLLQSPKKTSRPAYTKEELDEDIDVMFDLFENFYAAYTMFGGRETFDEVKQKIKSQVTGNMSKGEFSQIVVKELKVFSDGHMHFEGRDVYENDNIFMAEGVFIGKKEEEFYLRDESGVYRIEEPDEIRPYLKHTIDEKGRLSYALVGKVPIEKDHSQLLPGEVSISDRLGKQRDLKLEWKLLEGGYRGGMPYLSEETKNGVLIQRNTRVYEDSVSYETLRSEFEQYGQRASAQPAMILDLRGNPGGSVELIVLWSKAFLKAETSKNMVVGVDKSQYRHVEMFKEHHTEEELKAIFNDGWKTLGEMGGWTVQPKNILILSDKDVASSGEKLIFLLRQMDKTLVIGTPTAGVSFCVNPVDFYLPNTGSHLRFGLHLYFSEKISDDSESAIEPDLWVDPQVSEERTLKFMKYYKIGKN